MNSHRRTLKIVAIRNSPDFKMRVEQLLGKVLSSCWGTSCGHYYSSLIACALLRTAVAIHILSNTLGQTFQSGAHMTLVTSILKYPDKNGQFPEVLCFLWALLFKCLNVDFSHGDSILKLVPLGQNWITLAGQHSLLPLILHLSCGQTESFRLVSLTSFKITEFTKGEIYTCADDCHGDYAPPKPCVGPLQKAEFHSENLKLQTKRRSSRMIH